MNRDSINWGVFLREEKENIKKAMHQGDYAILVNLVSEMTPVKEMELQKIVNIFRAESSDFDSPVRAEINKSFLAKNPQDLTPDEEKEWQKKLDEEKEKHAQSVLNTDDVRKSLIDELSEDKVVAEDVKSDVVEDKEADVAEDKTETDEETQKAINELESSVE